VTVSPLNIFVGFARFYNLQQLVNNDGLKSLYHRACAVVLPLQTPGAEFLIPVRFAGLDDSGDLYGGVLVQLKTYTSQTKDSKYPGSAAYKLSPRFVFQDLFPSNSSTFINENCYIGLYIVIGGQRLAKEMAVQWNPTQYKNYMNRKNEEENQKEPKEPKGPKGPLAKRAKTKKAKANKNVEWTDCHNYWNLDIQQLQTNIFKDDLWRALSDLLTVAKEPTSTIDDKEQQARITKTLQGWIKPNPNTQPTQNTQTTHM